MMRRKAFLLVLCLSALAGAAEAQTLTYDHDDAPLFSITFPDGWLVDLNFRQEAEEAGTVAAGEEPELRVVEARPGDGRHVWVGLWVVPGARTLDEGADYFASLRQDLFTDVELSDVEKGNLAGMPSRHASGTAVREGAPVDLKIALFEPRAGIVAAALYVGEPEAWKQSAAELEQMAASIRPTR
jgi:hypothetical protein